MKALIAFVLIATDLTASHAQAQTRPIKIGVLNDQSGQYADASGPASVEVVRMAIQDFGGKLLGLPIEMISADHQNKPDIGSGIARKWYDTENVNVVLDLSNSAVALAVSEITREKNKIMIASSVGTSALTNEKCSLNSFQWSYNTYALARSTTKALVEQGGKDWFFLTADYAFGHALENDARSVVTQLGGHVLGAARHPFGTNDFSSFLIQAQNSGAGVLGLANTGLDVSTALRQAHEFGVLGKSSKMKAAALLLQITDTHAAGLANAQGLYMSEAYYWDRDDDSRRFGKRFSRRSDACRPWCKPVSTRRRCTT
nr:ABC transporter substrate-binding protein [Methylobacterium aquaticum]